MMYRVNPTSTLRLAGARGCDIELLRRQGGRVAYGVGDEAFEGAVFESGRCDRDEAAHRSAGEVHRARVGSSQQVLLVFRRDSKDELVAVDTAAHVPADQERQAAEHLLLADVVAGDEQQPDAFGECFVKGHQSTRLRGRPKLRKTLVSGKPVIATIWSSRSVSTMRPYARATAARGSRR